MLRKCCCRTIEIAIVQSWSSLHRGLGAAWRAAWPQLQDALRSLPVRWTTAIDFAGMMPHRAMISNWEAEVSARAPFVLDDGRRVAPWGRGIQALSKPIDECPPPDLASAPGAWGNLDALSNTCAPWVTLPFDQRLFAQPGERAWGQRAIVMFGGGVNRVGTWLRPAGVYEFGGALLPSRPTLAPPSVVDRSGFSVPREVDTIADAGLVHVFALNPSPQRHGFDDSLDYLLNYANEPLAAPGYAGRIAAATRAWASHDWGQFSDVPRLIDELRRIVAAVQAQRT